MATLFTPGVVNEKIVGFGQFQATVAVAASGAIKNAPGRLCTVTVTTAGTTSMTFFDNTSASGTILFITPATTTLGQIFQVLMPANIGIFASSGAGGPAVTLSFS